MGNSSCLNLQGWKENYNSNFKCVCEISVTMDYRLFTNLFCFWYVFLNFKMGFHVSGPSSFNILEGHSHATMLLICNNAAQGILSSFFFKYAGKHFYWIVLESWLLLSWLFHSYVIMSTLYFFSDTILKKYSSTVATIFTGIASAALFGHKITINFILGISIVFISMHQVIANRKKGTERVPMKNYFSLINFSPL